MQIRHALFYIGACTHTVNKWAFNVFTHTCHTALYTGGGGNDRFASKEDTCAAALASALMMCVGVSCAPTVTIRDYQR